MMGDFDARRGGSLPGKTPNKQRDSVSEDRGLMRDYFGVDGRPPVFDEKDFERRFRLPRVVFDRLYRDLLSALYFQQSLNATGQPQSTALQKLTSLRVLAFCVAYDSLDEHFRLSETTACDTVHRLSETTACETVHRFARFVIGKYKPVHLRVPTLADLQRVMSVHEEAGFPGCMGCVDCSLWIWKSCPMSLHGQYQGNSKKRSIVLETVADKDLYLWQFYIGLSGAMNDLNVMSFSPLFQYMLAGAFPSPIPYTVNGVERTLPYFLCDGIYPEHPVLINTSKGDDEKEKYFSLQQEGRRKDAEQVYGDLYQEWQILDRPARFHSVQKLVEVGTCCAILHNMIVAHRRKEAHAAQPGT